MAQILQELFNGADGATVTTGAWTGNPTGAGTAVYSTSSKAEGSASALFTGAANFRILEFNFTAATSPWLVYYVEGPSTAVSTNVAIGAWYNGATKIGDLRLRTDGTLQLRNNGVSQLTYTTPLAAGSWYRVAIRVTPGASTDTHQMKVYAGDSTTALYDQSNTSAGATQTQVTAFWVGLLAQVTGSVRVDAVHLDTGTEWAPAPLNAAPTANAGSDQSVTSGATVTLTGSATDTDGTIASYSWAQTSGTTVTLAGTGATRTFTAPTVATPTPLTFTLTATDDDGATGTDSVTVTVNPVSAGIATELFNGTDGAALTGGSWAGLSGTGTAVYSTASKAEGVSSALFTGAATYRLAAFNVGGIATLWAVGYVEIPAAALSATVGIVSWYNGATRIGDLRIAADRTLQLRNNNVARLTTPVLTAGAWYRVAIQITPGAATDTHRMIVYPGDDLTPIYDQVNTSAGAGQTQVTILNYGLLAAVTGSIRLDALRLATDTEWKPGGGGSAPFISETFTGTSGASITGGSWANLAGAGASTYTNGGAQFATTANFRLAEFEFAAVTEAWFVAKLRLVALSPTAVSIAAWWSDVTKVGDLRTDAEGVLTLRDGTVARLTTAPLTPGTTYRVAVRCVPGSSTGHRLKLYVGDSATPIYDETTAATVTTGLDQFDVGLLASSTATVVVGDLTAAATEWTPGGGGSIAPTAHAGADQTADPGATVTLAGSASDPDGTVTSYAWTQASGGAVTLTGSGPTRSFTAPIGFAGDELVFRFTATDNSGAQSPAASTTVTVLPATEAVRRGGVWLPAITHRPTTAAPPPAARPLIGFSTPPAEWAACMTRFPGAAARRFFSGDMTWSAFEMQVITDEVAAGRVPIVSCKPPGAWAAAAGGAQDAAFDTLVSQLEAVPGAGQIYFCIHHEPWNDTPPKGTSGSPQEWAAMQERFAGRVSPGSRVKYGIIQNGWLYNDGFGEAAKRDSFLPPSLLQALDWIGADTYEESAYSVRELMTNFAAWVRGNGAPATTPLVIGEFGQRTIGGLLDTLAYLETAPYQYVSYWANQVSAADPDWRTVAYSSEGEAAIRAYMAG